MSAAAASHPHVIFEDCPIIFAGSQRWTFDRGAMPGEPFAYLDGGSEDAAASMVEVQTPGRPTSFEVRGLGGVLIAQADFPDVAARLAEERVMPGQVDAHEGARPLEAGDKVFVISMRCLATVLNVYGDGLNGDHGDVRIDLCGNTPVTDLEHYDPAKHAQFDSAFVPICQAWKEQYGITKDIPIRQEPDEPESESLLERPRA